jgi:hypothetical protein
MESIIKLWEVTKIIADMEAVFFKEPPNHHFLPDLDWQLNFFIEEFIILSVEWEDPRYQGLANCLIVKIINDGIIIDCLMALETNFCFSFIQSNKNYSNLRKDHPKYHFQSNCQD